MVRPLRRGNTQTAPQLAGSYPETADITGDRTSSLYTASPVGLATLARRSGTASSSNGPANQEAISKPRDQGGHETGRRELPVRSGCLTGRGMDGLRRAGWAGR